MKIKLLASSNHLFDRMMVPQVKEALKAWIKATTNHGMLVGGLVVGVYSRPRMTMDVDIIFKDDSEIPVTVTGFKRIREHAFEHKKTGVEVKVLSPKYLSIPTAMYERVKETAILKEDIWVPSIASIIALKMMRASFRDLGDIEYLLLDNPNAIFDISGYHVPKEKWERVKQQLEQNKTQHCENIVWEKDNA